MVLKTEKKPSENKPVEKKKSVVIKKVLAEKQPKACKKLPKELEASATGDKKKQVHSDIGISRSRIERHI